MLTLIILLWWVAFTFAMAWGQGYLMPALKQTPDHTPQSDRQQFALHWIFGGAWFLPAILLLPFYLHWEPVVIALVVRFCLFDATLNYAEGTPVFAVGGSAITDQILQFIAKVSGVPVTVVSAVFRLLVFAGLVVFVWINS